jgi:hypothetical protein
MSRYGAFAYSESSGSYGYSSQQDEPEAAKKEALSFCNAEDAVILCCEQDCWIAFAKCEETKAYWCNVGDDGPTAAANALASLKEVSGVVDGRVLICYSTNDGEEYVPESPQSIAPPVTAPPARRKLTAGLLFISIPFIGIGLVAFVLGCWLGWSSWNAMSRAVRIEGKVVGFEAVTTPTKVVRPGQIQRARTGYAPLVDYTIEGRTYRISGHVSSSQSAYVVGDTVTVRYPPGQPAAGRVDSFLENWLGPIMFGGVGLLFAAVGLFLLIVRPEPARSRHAHYHAAVAEQM